MRRLACIALLAAAAALAGCQGSGRVDTPAYQRDPGADVSPELLGALAEAQNLHHQADVYLHDGKLDQAIGAVTGVLQITFPAGAPEGEDVQMDARARLGLLYLQAGRPDDAERVVADGLVKATRESFFVANLHQVMGKIYAARDDKHRAIEAYERGQQMNSRILQKVYEEAMK